MYRNRILTVVLALAAGLLGGVLSRYVTVPSVHAQVEPSHPVEIKAQRFSIVDPQGHVLGTFTAVAPQRSREGIAWPRVALVDPNGRELWSAGGTGFKPLAENLR